MLALSQLVRCHNLAAAGALDHTLCPALTVFSIFVRQAAFALFEGIVYPEYRSDQLAEDPPEQAPEDKEPDPEQG